MYKSQVEVKARVVIKMTLKSRNLLKLMHHLAHANATLGALGRLLSEVPTKVGAVSEVEVGSAKDAVTVSVDHFLCGSLK